MSPEKDQVLEQRRQLVVAMEIVKQNGPLSLKHPLCQDPGIRAEVEAILNSLNGKKEENSPASCDKI
jgi:hypothetical protein